jgi:hypothetical protein
MTAQATPSSPRESAGEDVPVAHPTLEELLEALAVPCTTSRHGHSAKTEDSITDVLGHWLQDAKSNLAVVAGPFGAGKTTNMKRFAAAMNSAGRRASLIDFAREGDAALESPATSIDGDVVIVDHFDSLNLATGIQKDPPDLRAISRLLDGPGKRIVLATRRLLSDRGDELVGQITNDQRCATLQVNDPWLVELLPWSLPSLAEIAATSNDRRAHRLLAFLGQLDHYHGSELRRPLLLSMLLRVLDEIHETPGIGDLYDKYIDQTVAHDFDAGKSVVSAAAKHDILRALASDIFTGHDPPDDDETRVTLGNERVSTRVIEGTEEAGLRLTSLPPGYVLVQDFLQTNHLFAESPKTRPFDGKSRTYEFRHPSFYDYFVGEEMAVRYEKGHSLGLRDETFSAATLDSLAIYFAKRRLTSKARTELRKAVTWPGLSWPDRLLMLYHLEDSLGFTRLLAETPEDYRRRLVELATSGHATFITKVIKFQLVLMGQFDAFQYVRDASDIERATDTQIEAQLQRGPSGSTEFLLARLTNRELKRAIPITVYRLGQMGDRLALSPLATLRGSNAQLDALVDEAIARIETRNGENKA